MKRSLLLVAAIAATLIPTPADAADRVDRVTAALRQSPVFVDPDVSYLLGAHDRTVLGRQIKAAGVPIFLVAVPLLPQDESAGDADYFGYLLHRRLGENGIYLIADQRGNLDWLSYQVPRDDTLNYDQAMNDKPLPQRLHDVIDALAKSPPGTPSDPATPRTPEPDPRQEKATGLAGHFLKAFFAALIVSGLLLGLAWWVCASLFHLFRTTLRTTTGRTTTRRTTMGHRRLRRMAEAELVRLARAIGTAGEDNPGYSRAMADYDAAKLLHDEQTDPGSRFGVVVLAFDGQDALRAGTANPTERCMVNPLHGPAERSVRTHLDGLRDATWPLCATCVKTTERRPLTLEIDGRKRPYYEAPGLWERIRGRSRDLPERVLEYLGVD